MPARSPVDSDYNRWLASGRLALSAYEKFKLEARCAHFGKDTSSLHHLTLRLRDGPDLADNLVPAYRRCSSSKGGCNVLSWAESKGLMPLQMMRRHLILACRWTEGAGLLDSTLELLSERNRGADSGASSSLFDAIAIVWGRHSPQPIRQTLASLLTPMSFKYALPKHIQSFLA